MKQFRSKSIAAQNKILKLALNRVKKVYAEINELSLRNWLGGEMQAASKVNEARLALKESVDKLREAEKILMELEKMAKAKGK